MIENLDAKKGAESPLGWLYGPLLASAIPSSQTLCTGQVVDSDCAPSNYRVDSQMIWWADRDFAVVSSLAIENKWWLLFSICVDSPCSVGAKRSDGSPGLLLSATLILWLSPVIFKYPTLVDRSSLSSAGWINERYRHTRAYKRPRLDRGP
jgi:hypothetical protein